MKIVIIGSGNVAWHLAKICKEKSHHLLQILNVHSKKISASFDQFQVPYCYSINEISHQADIYILAIKDNEIEKFPLPIFKEKQLVLHTSGITSIESFSKKSNNYGCIYPLQSFTKGINVEFSKVPLLIEASNVYTKNKLEEFAYTLSNNVQYIDFEKRKVIHTNAVIVNNFTNHILYLSQQFLNHKNIDFNLFLPLIEETIHKITLDSAYNAQTGPARRNDLNTIQQHEVILNKEKQLLELYQLLTASIIETYSPHD